MERQRSSYLVAFCAAVVGLQTAGARGQFQTPSCPTVEDTIVNVTAQQSAAFTVGVKNLGRGYVSIFQYPLGGTLIPSAKSTDFVFIPDTGFVGTSTFMFRVTPETGCPRGALLGKVTFVGPTTGRTFGKVTDTSTQMPACGTSVPMVIAVTGLVGLGWARRRR